MTSEFVVNKKYLDLGLTEQEVCDLKEVFDLIDKDKGGTLTAEEVKQLMELLGVKIQQHEVEAMLAEIDLDSSGQVDFDEFVQVMAKQAEMPYTKQEALRAFKMFVASQDTPAGYISPVDLEAALNKYCGSKISPEEVSRLMSMLDVTPDGFLDYARKIGFYMAK